MTCTTNWWSTWCKPVEPAPQPVTWGCNWNWNCNWGWGGWCAPTTPTPQPPNSSI